MVLDKASKAHPNTWWWVKADLSAGISESTKGIWSGDVDLNDGVLQAKYKEYVDRLSFIKSIGLSDCETKQQLMEDMGTCVEQISTDIAFTAKGKMYETTCTCTCTSMIVYDLVLELQQRNSEYCEKQNAGKASDSDKTLMGLAWDLKQLSELDEEGRKLKAK